MSEECTSEEDDDTAEDRNEESKPDSNIEEQRNVAPQEYIVCLKEDLKEGASLSKDSLLDTVVEMMRTVA